MVARKQRKRQKGDEVLCLLQWHASYNLTSFHEAPPPKGSTTSQQQHRRGTRPFTFQTVCYSRHSGLLGSGCPGTSTKAVGLPYSHLLGLPPRSKPLLQ